LPGVVVSLARFWRSELDRKGVLEVERWAELRREHFVPGGVDPALAERTRSVAEHRAKALRSESPPAFRCLERPSMLDPFKDAIHRLLREDPRLPVRVRELIARWVRPRANDR
jgi:hypothetical protein